MEIGPVSGKDQTRTPGPAQSPERAVEKQETVRPSNQAQDTVDISQNARALLSESADSELNKHGRDFGPVGESGSRADKLEAVRQRMKDGFYNRSDVREQIADRLMGDLGIGDEPGES